MVNISGFLVLLAATLLVISLFVYRMRTVAPKGEALLIAECMAQSNWHGPLREAQLESWQQTGTMHQSDYYFILTFILEIARQRQQKSAAFIIRSADIGLLKRGITVLVKYQGLHAKRIAVVEVLFNEK
ncbi:hypothetical protein N7922_10980 [Kosakonia sp. ML.JS2a]|uniref:hypothetical protein n=1 Tax=Kosakonia sp. ML.JS2a TaxID=2980557 RepID=UPI0021D874CA|nr:hypothetical protein [Kosakonia sp. ML.JS2a]UXY12992.1 hypothetical protein N7922_10980 [Kosakonia sp. ML.JS2a]